MLAHPAYAESQPSTAGDLVVSATSRAKKELLELCVPGDQLCDELEGIKNALAWAGRIDSKIGVSGIAWNANNIGNVGSIIFLLAGGGIA
ncbi:hypothetical protein ACOSQ3_028737 [Xanthoceras sorbifolium]